MSTPITLAVQVTTPPPVHVTAGWQGPPGPPGAPGTLVVRTATVATGTELTPDGEHTDQFEVTALDTAAVVAAPSGSPPNGKRLLLRIRDNGSAQDLAWDRSPGGYREVGVVLPDATLAGKVTYVGCIYHAQDGCWDVTAVVRQST